MTPTVWTQRRVTIRVVIYSDFGEGSSSKVADKSK